MRGRNTPEEMRAHIAANTRVDENGCHVWMRSLDAYGYGQLQWEPIEGVRLWKAHRVAAYLALGPLPEDKVIDHLCRNRACVNVAHLELVTQKENVYRSPIAIGTINAAKTHCSRGHEFTPENTRHHTWKSQKKSARICRTCGIERSREYAARLKAKRAAA